METLDLTMKSIAKKPKNVRNWSSRATNGSVIGTGAFRLMDGSSVRTPGTGLWDVSGQNLENYGVPADVYIDNTPADFAAGRDAQLQKAVEVLQEELRKNPSKEIPDR